MAELFPTKNSASEPSFCFAATSLTSELGEKLTSGTRNREVRFAPNNEHRQPGPLNPKNAIT
jgi:hypothetical protein